jgi:cellulose synthase/poly-beta-1,6-N-acetylglucosamine synthase-like glycosyltransferase
MIFPQVVFWFSIFLVLHTYILFPVILHLLARNRETGQPGLKPGPQANPGELPLLSVLIAAHNEVQVIGEKIASVAGSDYPHSMLEVLVGSDASVDGTDEILADLTKQHGFLKHVRFEHRTGKPGVVNHLAADARGEILVITDANVMLDRATLRELATSFAAPEVGLVDTRMINTRLKKDGISHQERFYINREVRIKQNESLIWGTMMGPFGGCYAVRKTAYRPVPGHFLVDDFYVNMAVLQQGYRCVSNTRAQVYEDVSNDLGEEFRRKKRISAGNFQNLGRFGRMILSRRPGVAFCFLSHKVIRWIVPLLVMITLGTSLFLAPHSNLYRVLALMQAAVLMVPVIDFFLRKLKIHSIPLRFVSHFVLMNLALMAGFLRYIGGIQSNVWQPTRRNQD